MDWKALTKWRRESRGTVGLFRMNEESRVGNEALHIYAPL
jgi:hypothetical protein